MIALEQAVKDKHALGPEHYRADAAEACQRSGDDAARADAGSEVAGNRVAWKIASLVAYFCGYGFSAR